VDLLEHVFNLVKYTEKDVSKLLAQLFGGLHYLHSLGIVHRNVKPTSIIVRTTLIFTLSLCPSVRLSVTRPHTPTA